MLETSKISHNEENTDKSKRTEMSSDRAAAGGEARNRRYLWWRLRLALTGGAALVLSGKNHPLLPQNERRRTLRTRISERGGLPEVNRLDKKHKARKKAHNSLRRFPRLNTSVV